LILTRTKPCQVLTNCPPFDSPQSSGVYQGPGSESSDLPSCKAVQIKQVWGWN